ncbi:hypothetical protein GGF46_001934 [Coemansia sp. RSA 552]|nr:hypothetical protein GGF46_001934 [Coemansia sp. RSA 552]
MNGLQTPIRKSASNAAPAAAGPAPQPLGSPFRTPIRTRQNALPASPANEYYGAEAEPSTPKQAFSPRGRWINPEAQRVLDDRAAHPNERQSTMRLRWNVASLIVLAWCSQTGVYRQIKGVGQAAGMSPYVWSSLEWLGMAVLAYNIGEAVWYLLQPAQQYTDFPMTPSQRLRVGLDSRAQSTAKGAPVSAPRMTPSKAPSASKQTPGSVTDLESRRRTPVKGSTTPNGRNTTPRILRSPVAQSASAAQADYSTDGDLLTLTQVLNKVPGASSLTDNVLTTPTRGGGGGGDFALGSPPLSSQYGDSNLVTPRLPVSRYGLGDMAATTPLQQHLRGQPSFGLYQTATPASRASGREGTPGLSKDRSVGGVEYLEPHEVLEKYGVERDIFNWVENMHVWFVRHLLRPLCKQINELDSLFEQHGLGHLSCKNAVLDKAALEQAQASKQQSSSNIFGSSFSGGGFGGGFGTSMGSTNVLSHGPASQSVPQTLVELSMRYGELPQTKERMALEKYLLVPGYTCRDYIIQRVAALSQSSALPAYIFDGGGSHVPSGVSGSATGGASAASGASSLRLLPGEAGAAGQPWSATQHPTDAQLLFHLFCTFMDQTMPPVQNTRRPFTDRFVLQSERKPNSNLPVQITMVSRKKPHFCLVVKGCYYDVSANRNNLFLALILFVLIIKRECAGYLGLTNLGGKHVDLLSVTE